CHWTTRVISVSAGLALAAVVRRAEIVDAAAHGELGGTYAGSPVACAAALAVIDIIEEEQILEKSEKNGQKIDETLTELAKKYEYIGEIRRLGAMVGVEIVQDRDSKRPNKEKTNEIVSFANENGLLLLSAGIKGNVIRF